MIEADDYKHDDWMYNGIKKKVKIHFANYMYGVFLDRFGKDITFHKLDDDHSELNVDTDTRAGGL